MQRERAPLDVAALNDWVAGPGADKRLSEAKQKQMEVSMKRQLKNLQRESTRFQIEEEAEVTLSVSLPSALPSDEKLDEMKLLYAALDDREAEIESLENQIAVYHQMSLWDRLLFLFTG